MESKDFYAVRHGKDPTKNSSQYQALCLRMRNKLVSPDTCLILIILLGFQLLLSSLYFLFKCNCLYFTKCFHAKLKTDMTSKPGLLLGDAFRFRPSLCGAKKLKISQMLGRTIWVTCIAIREC